MPALALPPIVAADPTRTSAIEITDSTTYVLQQNNAYSDMVCLGFVNHGTGLATKVGFSIALLDASGNVASVDVMYPTGKFPVGTRSAFSGGSRDQAVPNANCHSIGRSGATRRSQVTYQANRNAPATDIVALLISTREIVYQDGTAWRSDQVPQTGDHLALPAAPAFNPAVPAGQPVVSFAQVSGAPIEMTDAFATETFTQTGGGAPTFGGLLGVLAAMPVTTRARSYCMSFANRDAREVKLARVNLAVLDRTGKVVGIDTLDSKGPFAQAAAGTESGVACEGLRGKGDGDTFMYQPKDGDPVATGRVVILPAFVEFTDGTTWTAPNPPVIGTPLANQ
ncbi:MAG TPA: hypothetical protein VHS78_10980 [Candidatus Elarobacter sp.]|nr:hypothetical protein [Candidatus Elarobacter sp.]